MSWIYDLGDDGYGEHAVQMPRLNDWAFLDIVKLIEAAEESSDETLIEAARYLGFLVEDRWEDDIRVVTYEVAAQLLPHNSIRFYGGPEEGGWWWDAHHTVKVSDPVEGDTWTDRIATAEKLAKALRAPDPTAGRYRRINVEVHPEGKTPEMGHNDVRQPHWKRPRYR